MHYNGLYLILITILLIIIYIILYINTIKYTYKGGNIITNSFDSLNTLYTNTKQDIQNSEILNKSTTIYDNTKQDIQNKLTNYNLNKDLTNNDLTTDNIKLNEIMNDINELSQNVKIGDNISSYTLAPKTNIEYIKTGSTKSIEMLDNPIQETTLKPYIQTKTKIINKEEQDKIINDKLNSYGDFNNNNNNKLESGETYKQQQLYEYENLKPVQENNYDEYGYKLMTGWELPIHKKPLCIKNPNMKCPPCNRKNNNTTHYLRVDRDNKKIENDFSNITKYNSNYKPLSDELMTDRYLKKWNRPLGSMDDIPECLECPPCYDDFDNRVSVL